jgi:hypothetical protein
MGRRWTDQDVSELKLLAQHHPPQKIAELTNRTVGGIVFKAHTLKVSLRCLDMPREIHLHHSRSGRTTQP